MARKKQESTPKEPVKPPRDRAVDAALSMAGLMGWGHVTLADIADEAGLTLAEMHDLFEDKTDILAAYGRRLDRQALDAIGAPDPALSPRERLFDILMERFDALNGDRAAVLSILGSLCAGPQDAAIALPHLGRSMHWMLEAAGIETAGLRGALKIVGLLTVYLAALWQWRKDESADLSATMAALDRALGRAERCANSIGL